MEEDLAANAADFSKDLLGTIIANVYDFTGCGKVKDDMTMVCIKRLRRDTAVNRWY